MKDKMADKKIVERALKKLTEEEYLNLKDYIMSGLKFEDRKSYAKGYNAGVKLEKEQVRLVL